MGLPHILHSSCLSGYIVQYKQNFNVNDNIRNN